MATTDPSFLDLLVSKVNFDDLIMQLEKCLAKIISIFLFLLQINFQESYFKINA